MEHAKLFALVWDRREKITEEQYYFVTVYTDRTARDFICGNLDGESFRPVGEVRYHWFGGVPVIAYTNNDDRQGILNRFCPLIDAYDGLMSSRLTDKKKFVDALLVFFGMTLAEGDEAKLAREKFIDGAPWTPGPSTFKKPSTSPRSRCWRTAWSGEMHKMTLTVDMSDEQFAGNSSGQALKLKLLTMDLLARSKMRRMERGLRQRLELQTTGWWSGGHGDGGPQPGGCGVHPRICPSTRRRSWTWCAGSRELWTTRPC